MYHIRNKFQHRSVKKKVMETVEYDERFVRFTTSGLVVLLAIKLLDVTLSDITPATDLKQLAVKIVEFVAPSIDNLDNLDFR